MTLTLAKHPDEESEINDTEQTICMDRTPIGWLTRGRPTGRSPDGIGPLVGNIKAGSARLSCFQLNAIFSDLVNDRNPRIVLIG